MLLRRVASLVLALGLALAAASAVAAWLDDAHVTPEQASSHLLAVVAYGHHQHARAPGASDGQVVGPDAAATPAPAVTASGPLLTALTPLLSFRFGSAILIGLLAALAALAARPRRRSFIDRLRSWRADVAAPPPRTLALPPA